MWLPPDLQAGETVLVSSCLAGQATRYDGGARHHAELLQALAARGVAVLEVCPEMLGGLPVPRPAAELTAGDGHAVLAGHSQVALVQSPAEGAGAPAEGSGGAGVDRGDVTGAFRAGAEATLQQARQHQVRYAFLQERSPSCGVQQTHSGGGLITGPGVTSALLQAAGLMVIGVG